jgi:hypothetical protein
MTELGDVLLELAASSQLEFVMCAPFAKQAVVSRIVSALPDGARVILYTRWRPEEVAAGVSDTGVLKVIQARGGVVYLHDRLHAKFYRNENQVILGSANLTGTALGWSTNPNIELLATVDPETVAQVEQQLLVQSIQATSELAVEVDTIAQSLRKPAFVSVGQLEESAESVGLWLPKLRIPADLFLAYSRGLETLTSRSSAAAAVDLEILDLPPGLSKEQFYLLVGHRLRQQPLAADIDDYLKQPRRFGEVRDRIDQLTAIGREDASDAWQTLMRWLLEFLPDRYTRQVPRHSELFSRRTSDMETRS